MADKVAKLISPHANVYLLTPPNGLRDAGDIVDAVTQLAWDAEAIRAYMKTGKRFGASEEPPVSEKAAGPMIWQLSDLRTAEFPTRQPIIEDLLHEGETIGLVGRPKTGKTRLVQMIVIALSRGQSFLGHSVPSARRVLVIDLENRPAATRGRFMKMSEPADGDRNVYIYAPETLIENPLNLSTPRGIKTLCELVIGIKPDVLIIDTWRLLLGGDESKAETVVRALKTLSQLRQALPDLSTVIVHHTRKISINDSPVRLRIDPSAWIENTSGSYSFIGHLDGCYGLEREVDQKTGDELIVFGGVARNSSPRTLLLEDDPETLLFRTSQGEIAAEKLFTNAESLIWSAIATLQVFSFSDVLERSLTKNKKAAVSTLRKAESVKLITKGLDRLYRRIS
jgi:hypothetical protein